MLPRGFKHTEETKRRMSVLRKGKKRPPFSNKWKNNISKGHRGHKAWNKGIPFSSETRRKMSEARRGSIPWNRGGHHSVESRRKMSESHKGKKFSEERKLKMKGTRTGEKNPSWKGGITPINLKIRTSLEYELWRKSVFERDNYTCIWCGLRNGGGKTVILNADHIKPFFLYPELRFAIDNGRTLCRDCHRKTDTYGYHIKKAERIKNYDKSCL